MPTMTHLPVSSSVSLAEDFEAERHWSAGTVATIVDTYGDAGAAVEIVDDEGYTLDVFDVPWAILRPAAADAIVPHHHSG